MDPKILLTASSILWTIFFVLIYVSDNVRITREKYPLAIAAIIAILATSSCTKGFLDYSDLRRTQVLEAKYGSSCNK